MNNPLMPTADATVMRLPLTLTCVKNELDENTLVHNVELFDAEYVVDLKDHGINGAAGLETHKVTLPVPQDMADTFTVGQEYPVEVSITIYDRGFTPFKTV